MPKVKSDLSKQTSESRKENGWNSGQLFGTESSDSFSGGGFKDKSKALETVQLLDGKDITYQYHVINSMYNRAKVILKRTKDGEKIKNLKEAVDVFDKWIADYKGHSRHKENLGYLTLDVVEAYQKLANHHGIKDNGFLKAYKEVKGDYKKLRNKKVAETEVTWDVHRNKALKPLSDSIRSKNECMYETDESLNGLPTKVHVEMILWGYSPDVSKVKKAMNLIEEKIQN